MERLGADHYRKLEADARGAAERTNNDILREQFLELAECYDRLARQLEWGLSPETRSG